jgi:hypothetical protein
MKKIVTLIKEYACSINKNVLFLSTVFITIAVFINYHYHIQAIIRPLSYWQKLLFWYLLFLVSFSLPYILSYLLNKPFKIDKTFIILLLLAPAIFAWKIATPLHFNFSNNAVQNSYWNKVVYWPFKCITLTSCLFVIWRSTDKNQPFYGLKHSGIALKPYLLMLLFMVPLIALASTQPDFLAVYPKLKNSTYAWEYNTSPWYSILYEFSYGIDFFSIELFFRGFLILAFIKYAGKEAILPMAAFYCTIHFGKPLGECISSYIGGIILGVITYYSRSIYGGLMVHLGIAWLMELGGYLGN